MIAALYNIPTERNALMRFSFHNADAHSLAVRGVRALSGILLPEYPIDPIPETDFGAWLYTHQALHNSVNAALGLAGNDLSDVDPTKLDELTSWIQLHATEHVNWGNILGYG